jgi:nicotinamide-nucleotide amidase
MKRVANTLVKTLQQKKLTLALAESVTCGLAAHQLSLVKGTSDVLQGSIVCYDEKVKRGLLQVSKALIEKHTTESQQVTDALAKNLEGLLEADIYAAITGLADEGGSETKEKPVGTVFLSIYYKRRFFRRRKLFRGSPLTISKKACKALYEFILETVNA